MQCQSEIMDPLSFTLMGGYDLVIPIISSFDGSNNLKNLTRYDGGRAVCAFCRILACEAPHKLDWRDVRLNPLSRKFGIDEDCDFPVW